MDTLSVPEKVFFFICGFGILQGILLAALIYLHPKSDRSVNLFLALYIFCTSAVMSLPFIMKIVGWQNSFFIQPVPMLSGPLLYLYIRSFKESITWRKAWPHFILFFLYFFYAYWNISILKRMFPHAKEVPAGLLYRPATIIIQFVKVGQLFTYYFLARRTLLTYQRSLRHLFSETSRIDLQWTRFLVNGFLVLVLAFIVIFPLMLRYPSQFNLLLLINMAVAIPYIYMASYKGVLQATLWQVQPGTDKKTVESTLQQAEKMDTAGTVDSKQTKPGAASDRLEELVAKITTLMEQEKLYQETELTLQQLARTLQVPSYQVSQALNEGMKKNFYDLINGYRVEEAKRLLLDPQNTSYTILSVGFEAGFNSKTTFNTVFKKFTGLTPTEYREKAKQVLV